MNPMAPPPAPSAMEMPHTRGYQQEMLNESLRKNIIIALDTGSGKTLIAVLRIKHELEREKTKISWFFAPTVALCQQQLSVIKAYLPVSVGIVSGANEPDQWKDASLWTRILSTHRIVVSTPQVFLDALRHGYISLGRDISLLVFDEAHHAVDNHPYNRIMTEFYFALQEGRPGVLGLTASPIYGGNVERAFKTIESNLDSIIRAPRHNRAELASYVHPPVFKHILYLPPAPHSFSTNLAALETIAASLDIEDDPYVISLRSQLARTSVGSPEHRRVDQKLSKVISKQNTFTHKGMLDFVRAGRDICNDIGPWAADWFVWKVLDRARAAANPFGNLMVTWRGSEKAYLLSVLNRVVASPVSYYADDIVEDLSDKTRALIQCLLAEKKAVEEMGEMYSCIVFVQRRDAVLALAEVLNSHPDTKDVFATGTLLGSSDSTHRHALMDITRSLVREVAQEVVLADFKSGARNLIISTAVAEEGIDIQACGSVIRWDLPPNMASWTQSKGRARKRRSTFTVMFEQGSKMEELEKWFGLERRMKEGYNDPIRDMELEEDVLAPVHAQDGEDEDMVLKVESTGAVLTLHSAISHLTHFCAVIPNSVHADNVPLFELDPPEFPLGWNFSGGPREPYTGPYGSKVILPRALPLPLEERTFTVPTMYKSIISAHRHVAFVAYKALYEKGLLNDNLLPMASVVEPQLEEEVKKMLAEVEKRQGLASVTMGIDPWAAPTQQNAHEDTMHDDDEDVWHTAKIHIEGLAPLWLFTRSPLIDLGDLATPTLYRPGGLPPLTTSLHYVGPFTARSVSEKKRIHDARVWTRAVFWGLNSSRMEWDELDFSYLFLPVDETLASPEHCAWVDRRTKIDALAAAQPDEYQHHMAVRADVYGDMFGYGDGVTLVQRHLGFGRPFRFIRWRGGQEKLDAEEEERVRETYRNQKEKVEITYPLLEVEAFPPRSNFLVPPRPKARTEKEDKEHVTVTAGPTRVHLLSRLSAIVLLSAAETQYAFLLPSILRFLSMRMTALSLRTTFFTSSSTSVGALPSLLSKIPLDLLTTAITAPASGEQRNYQRLETLGDTVLKFVAGVNLLAEYPLWHEGYLSRKKDHAVSNVRLAKEDLKRGMYQWIIRETMLGKKWQPRYASLKEKKVNKAPTDSAKQLQNAQEAIGGALASPALQRAGAIQDVDLPHVGDNTTIPPTGNEGLIQASTDGPVEPAEPLTKTSKKKKSKAKSKQRHQLSTKVLADVVESTIGAAYLHGSFDLGYECIKFFDLGLKWAPLSTRITQMLARVDCIPVSDFAVPAQLAYVEQMFGYTFKRKLLLIEALTHASYQQDSRTPSYERMEFLGDSVLDMIVTHTLYHAAGKNYSPGHMHLRKSAVVNGHILSYFCLKTSTMVESEMPHFETESRGIKVVKEAQEIYLWKCLLHSSPKVLEDQLNAATRFMKWGDDIGTSLMTGPVFPWAALTRLQAPKFFSDIVESVLGAIFLDSGGSLDAVALVLRTVGILPLLEHIIKDDVDVLHPVSRLSLWAQKHGHQIQYEMHSKEGKICCSVVVDGVEEAREEAQWRGKPSQEEVKYNVAEAAIKKFKLKK